MLSLPSFFASATSSFIGISLPFSGGFAAAARPREASAAPGAERIVRPVAAATLRRSIWERLIPSSSSLRQNSTSCAS